VRRSNQTRNAESGTRNKSKSRHLDSYEYEVLARVDGVKPSPRRILPGHDVAKQSGVRPVPPAGNWLCEVLLARSAASPRSSAPPR